MKNLILSIAMIFGFALVAHSQGFKVESVKMILEDPDPNNPKDSGGWALSPHGVWDSHIPEVFPQVIIAGPAG